MPSNSAAKKKRNRKLKQEKMKETYARLQHLSPVQRTRRMEEKFGPCWYYVMLTGEAPPEEVRESARYTSWHLNFRDDNRNRYGGYT